MLWLSHPNEIKELLRMVFTILSTDNVFFVFKAKVAEQAKMLKDVLFCWNSAYSETKCSLYIFNFS